MIVRKTGPEEARRVNELFALAFETAAEKGPADPENDRICHWAAFTEGGEMMSTLSVTDFEVNFDGQRCKMGGVGGVATPPQFRRRGGIRACFTRALPELYRAGYDFSYLFPFSTAYYRQFGYESCPGSEPGPVHAGGRKLPSCGAGRHAQRQHPRRGPGLGAAL